MPDWQAFSDSAPAIAAASTRLLERNEVAFLATVAGSGRPRIHPFVPKIVAGRLLAFVMDSSPKIGDLRGRPACAIHPLPGPEDEEVYLGCTAREPVMVAPLREQAADAMGFATGVDEHHVLFEFLIERALWTRWLDFRTPDHRPLRQRWLADG